MADYFRFDPAGGRTLEDALFEQGAEFPCGGLSFCGGCRVRVVSGEVPITPGMRQGLSGDQLDAGWRLACLAMPAGPVVLEIAQWQGAILTDESAVPIEPAEGLGIAVDLGTTTVVAQLVDLSNGGVLGVATAWNPQARHGADIMSRIQYDVAHPGELTAMIRQALGVMLADLSAGRAVREVMLCGNTVMHHLFAGHPVEPLASVPFESPNLAAFEASSSALAWSLAGDPRITFFPCFGGFVGSDILAGVVATGMLNSVKPQALVDLGTNGEIVLGSRAGALCASTAAGPAFEAGRIKMGMRAVSGAIDRVAVSNGSWHCHVLGGAEPRGICGSGLVDAAAVALDLNLLQPNGRFADGSKVWDLAAPVTLAQSDIRELQLAKGAVASGLELLRRRLPLDRPLLQLNLAGAFGNYIDIPAARRIGLLPAWVRSVIPSGNAALRGTRQILLAGSRRHSIVSDALLRVRHLSLGADAEFQDAFVESMPFPSEVPHD